MNTAIIVAAGSGERFRSEIPKQFLKIADKPLIVYTIERFEAAPSVDSVVVVFAAEWIERFEPYRQSFTKVHKVLPGKDTRAGSVQAGLEGVDSSCEIVAVHDGARPLVSVDEIERTIAKAGETGAACLVAPVTDTIKSVRAGEIAATLDRDRLRRALTPQAFRKDVLQRAFELADPENMATDDSYLVEKLGHPVAIVEGSSINIKITLPEDLILAEALMRQRFNS